MEDGSRKDLRQGSDPKGGEDEPAGAGGSLTPEQRIAQPPPGTGSLPGREAPHEQRQRGTEDERARGVDAVGRGLATDGHESGHHLTGQAGEHGQGEARRQREPLPQVLVEGAEKKSRHHHPEGEQPRRPRLGAEVAQGLLAEEIEPAQDGGGEQGRPYDGNRSHARVPKRSTHPDWCSTSRTSPDRGRPTRQPMTIGLQRRPTERRAPRKGAPG